MLSNIFKSGIPGVRTVSQEPFVIDVNSRVIEPPKPRVIRPKNDVPEGSAEAGDTFEAGITEMAATINLEEHKELLDDAMEKAKLLQDDARERAQKILEDAKADAEAIRKAAQEEGFAKGGSIPVTSFLFLLKNSENSVKNHKKSQKITATINILCYTTLV